MNISSENRALIYAVAAGVLALLILLLVVARRKSKKRNQRSLTSAIPTKAEDKEGSPDAGNIANVPIAPIPELVDFSQNDLPKISAPEFIELFVIEDPLDGSGYLGTQINRQISYISDFEIRALINRYQNELLSEQALRAGFAEKTTVAGKIRTVLYGEVEAIAKATTAFHPEIAARIEQATLASADFRLLAIDGLVYGVFLVGVK
ncbi:MAG: hypothetical protein WCH42_03980 [Actinomycetes bacterium]